MSLIKRTIYPLFPATFTAKDLTSAYTPSREELIFTKSSVRGPSSVLNFLAMLKAFQQLHYFPHPVEMPMPVLEHIHTCLKLTGSDTKPTSYPSSSFYCHQHTIREYLGVKSYDRTARRLALQAVYEVARTREDLADLINVAIEALLEARYELPAFSTLELIARRVRNLVNQAFFRNISARINEKKQAELEVLMVAPRPHRPTPFDRLKTPPKNATLVNLREWLSHVEWLEGLGKVDKWLVDLPLTKLKYFAAQASSMSVSEMKACRNEKRLTLLACLIWHAQVTTRDSLVEMFVKRMALMHKNAKDELKLIQEKHRELGETLIDTLAEITELAGGNSKLDEDDDEAEDEDELDEVEVEEGSIAEHGLVAEELEVSRELELDKEIGSNPERPQFEEADARLGRQVRLLLTEKGGADTLLEACQTVNAYQGDNHLPLMPRFYKPYRGVIFRLIRSLKIHSATQNVALEQALALIMDKQASRRKWLPDTVDLNFTTEVWRRTIRKRRGRKRKYRLHRRLLEICVFSYLAVELRCGDMYVEGTEEYADYRAQLLSWEECQPQLAEYCAQLGLSGDAKTFTAKLRELLANTAHKVDVGMPDNTSVRIEANGQLVLKRQKRAEKSAQQAALVARVRHKMDDKPRSLLQILSNTEHWCNWSVHFGPLSGNEDKLERTLEKYLYTVFAYGSNLGPTQTSLHLDGTISADQLSFINRTHINTTKLEAANACVINTYNRFNLPKMWGNVKVAAADGTKIELPEHSLFSERHFRYGHVGGVAYHHVSDTYVALFTHFIACGIWEAVFVIDGLLKNKSEIQPDTLHADTQGQSSVVFGLSYLLGIKLMPRIRNWQGLDFFRPDKNTRYQHIDQLFKDTIDWDKLERHWQDMMQVVLSVKAGKILPSTLLKKLGSYSRKNKLQQAFDELGHVIRTIFLLECISNPKLRTGITATTNKVESYNSFTDWIKFGGEALLSVFDPDEREKRLKYTDLLANLIMLQNVADLTQYIKELQNEGLNFSKEDVATLSPYMTRHLRRFGEYILKLEDKPTPLDDELLTLVLQSRDSIKTS